MAVSRIIQIDGKDVALRSSAALPRLYRFKFRRDLMLDMAKLEKAQEQMKNGDEQDMSIVTLEVFENVAYIMALHAAQPGEDFPASPDEWLEQFNVFSIYDVLPTIMQMWGLNTETLVKPKKEEDQLKES